MPARLKWMWVDEDSSRPAHSTGYLVRFRSVVTIGDAMPIPVNVSIAADSRYRLFVNGRLAATGPEKPSGGTWFADSVDIGPLLQPGVNVVGMEVLAYPDPSSGNVSVQRSGTPGLSVEGSLPGQDDFSDTAMWRCATAPGRVFHQGTNTLFLGIQESVDGLLEPQGWLHPTFDDTGWPTPVEVWRPDDDPIADIAPRSLPPMAMEPVVAAGISRHRGPDPGWSRLLDDQTMVIGPHSDVNVDFDLASLITAFIDLELSGGEGATVELTAAECYEGVPIAIPWLRRKGDRTDAVKGDLYGDPDLYRVAGSGTPGMTERYSPFWFRTGRYLRLAVRTGDAALSVHRLTLIRTHYPLELTGSFGSSSELDTRLWDTSLRTLLNCMHETFVDCPFYEQLQYAMDTRSQALFSMHLSADDRLVRRAIRDFAASGDPLGLTDSRSPCIEVQVIPGFSLFWVLMVGDHLDHVGDRGFTHEFLPRMHSVLGVFDRALAEDGFVLSPPDSPAGDGRHEVWNFVDWTEAWRARRGVPDLGSRGANTIVSFQYVAALSSAARTAHACGENDLADEYRERAADVLKRLGSSSAWDRESLYFRDSDTGAPASQHAQVWAVLAGAVTAADATDLLARAVRDPSLVPCSYATSLSFFDALRQAGAHDLVDWQPWADTLELGLTTWPEDTVNSRSDCHGWGSVHLQHFPRWVLGVQPLSPGFATVSIDPAPSHLGYAEGTVPTPHGPIHVRWDQYIDGDLSVAAQVPRTVELVLPATSRDIRRSIDGDHQVVTFSHPVGPVVSTLDLDRSGLPMTSPDPIVAQPADCG